MRKIYVLFGLVITIVFISSFSCIDRDENSLDKFRVDIATVEMNTDSNYYLILDNEKRLYPVSSDINYVAKERQRVFANYTILSGAANGYDNYIKINDIWDILTKKVINLTQTNADSIGNDPIKVNDMWIGNDFLNVDFMFNYGGIKPHAINLVNNTLASYPNDGKVHLEFRHNAYNSQKTQLYEGFVCFDLKPFRVNTSDSVELSIKIEDKEEGAKTFDVVYRYNEALLKNSQTEKPIPVISSNEYN